MSGPVFMRRTGLRVLALAVAAALAAGCASGPVARSVELFPADASIPASIRTIAVLPSPSPARFAPDVAGELEVALAAVRVAGQPYFQVVDRRQIGHVLREIRLSETGHTDPAQAARAGQLLGAQALVQVQLVQHDLRAQPVLAQRLVCVQSEPRSDRRGQPVPDRCLKTEWQPTRCTLQTARVQLRVRLVETSSGRVVAAHDLPGLAEQTVCPGDTAVALHGHDLLQRARAQAVQDARLALAPSYRPVYRPLLSAWPAGNATPARQSHERALAFAAAGRMEPACALWGDALQQAEGRTPATLHNLGVCAELDGRLQQALSLHRQAERQLTAPDRTIAQAIARVTAALSPGQP